ncbi:MAG: DUF2247 family protein [Ancrocorticia sp.]
MSHDYTVEELLTLLVPPNFIEDLVKFVLPPEFILARVVPTVRELVYGYHHGWVDDEGAVRLAEAQYALGMQQTPSVEDVALLLRDERYNVERLMHAAVTELEAENVGYEGEEPWRLWLYLALAWMYDHRSNYEDPLTMIQMLSADFWEPDEIRNLIIWVSKNEGEVAKVVQNWQDYVSAKGTEYADRTARFADGEWTPTNGG